MKREGVPLGAREPEAMTRVKKTLLSKVASDVVTVRVEG
jgi:hypothetical protein